MDRPLSGFDDIHTHNPAYATGGKALVSVSPGFPLLPDGHYSVGIHPWDAIDGISPASVALLEKDAMRPCVEAIGEAGFDRLRGPSADIQRALFDIHASLSAATGKPLIIHCVRGWDLLLAAVARWKPAPGMWIVHGFRGKPALARQLLDSGLALSYGLRYNEESFAATPPLRRYRETDSPSSNSETVFPND